MFAALGDPARLRIVDMLSLGDATPSELSAALGMPSNLLAHHLVVLTEAGLVLRTRSEGDRRRVYCQLLPEQVPAITDAPLAEPSRVLFVCTANSARSHLAAALWRQTSAMPSTSAGTAPATRIDPRAVAAAKRRQVTVPLIRPRSVDTVAQPGDLIVTVCDLAREVVGDRVDIHWSIPDPVRVGTSAAFNTALDQISHRVHHLAHRLAA